MRRPVATLALLCASAVGGRAAGAQAPYFFSNGNVDGRIALATRPAGPGTPEIEAADDFVLGAPTRLASATFIGLLPGGATPASISQVVVEIYRVFPLDSQNPPSGRVPTRTNSPSDVAFDSRSSSSGLSYTTSILAPTFTAANSILNGINPFPNQTTGGEGAVTGQQVQVSVSFASPFDLPADHYFFVPQVQLTNGTFYWLSSVRPIVAPGTPFAPDLQAWIRNDALDPDWLRAGTDIVGGNPAPTFNAAFTLTGTVVPEPSSLLLLAAGLAIAGTIGGRARRRA